MRRVYPFSAVGLSSSRLLLSKAKLLVTRTLPSAAEKTLNENFDVDYAGEPKGITVKSCSVESRTKTALSVS